MSDTLNFTEIDTQYIELLPARTVMSVFRTGPTTTGGETATGGTGAASTGKEPNLLDILSSLTVKDALKLLGGGGK
jgi:hypothetical protein